MNKKTILEKINGSSSNDIAIIESCLAIFNKAVLYNEQGRAVNIVDLV